MIMLNVMAEQTPHQLKTGNKYVGLVSRRAAGVWTHLPSLTYMLLSKQRQPRPVLWVDFGLRYEMFNHLLINPSCFPERSSLLALSGTPFDRSHLITYSSIAVNNTVSDAEELCISEIRGSNVDGYREYVRQLSLEGRDAFLLPLQVPSLHLGGVGTEINITAMEDILGIVESEVQPSWTFFTFEGQPEVRIFAKLLEEDRLLNWSLNKAKIILSLVRFDSKQRFDDGVAIPSYLSRIPNLRDRLRIVLTRCLFPPVIQSELKGYVLGVLPFANFVGESVNNGRIPIIDIWCRQKAGHNLTEEQGHYLNDLGLLSDQLINSL